MQKAVTYLVFSSNSASAANGWRLVYFTFMLNFESCFADRHSGELIHPELIKLFNSALFSVCVCVCKSD